MRFLPNLALTDLNGVDWTLSAPGCAIRLVKVQGLDGAPFEFDKTNGVDQPGVTVVARDDKENRITLSLRVGPMTPGDAAVETVQEFLDGLGRGWARGGRHLRLTCLDTARFQDVRLAEQYAPIDWPRLFDTGFINLEVVLQSDESWWRTAPVGRSFTAAQFASATVPGSGNVDRGAWPWWRVDGPITGLKLGVAPELVPVPITLTAGQWLEIQTDPDEWSVRNHTGADVTWSVGARWHQRVPSRVDTVPLLIQGSGTSAATRVQIIVPQLFEAALR